MAMESAIPLESATALFSFEAREPNEVSFNAGDQIFVLVQHNSDWWEGLAPDGQQGFFPANYVQLDEPEPPPPPSTIKLSISAELDEFTRSLENEFLPEDLDDEELASAEKLQQQESEEAAGSSSDEDEALTPVIPAPPPPQPEPERIHKSVSRPVSINAPQSVSRPASRPASINAPEPEPFHKSVSRPVSVNVSVPVPEPLREPEPQLGIVQEPEASLDTSKTAPAVASRPKGPTPVARTVSTGTMLVVDKEKKPEPMSRKPSQSIVQIQQGLIAPVAEQPPPELVPLGPRKPGSLISALQQQVSSSDLSKESAPRLKDFVRDKDTFSNSVAALQQGLMKAPETKPREQSRPKDLERDPNAPSLSALQQNLASVTGGVKEPSRPKEVIERDPNAPSLSSLQQSLAANLGGNSSAATKSVPNLSAVPATPPNEEETLPAGWKAAKDASGRVYFYNATTKETSWTPPVVAPAAVPVQAVQAPAPPPQVVLPAVEPASIPPPAAVAPVATAPADSGRRPAPTPLRAPAPTAPPSAAPRAAAPPPPQIAPLARALPALPSAAPPAVPMSVPLPSFDPPPVPSATVAPAAVVAPAALPSRPTAPPPLPAIPPSPVAMAAQATSLPPPPAAPAPAAVVADTWRTAYTADNRPYYFNTVTQEVTWTLPNAPQQPTRSTLNVPGASPNRNLPALPSVPNQRPTSMVSTVSAASSVNTQRSEEDDHESTQLIQSNPMPEQKAVKRKEGFVFYKHDKMDGGKKSSSRKWIHQYAILYKGVLYFYKENPNNVIYKTTKKEAAKEKPDKAVDIRRAIISVDHYKKKDSIITITTVKGSEWLIQALDAADAQSWIDAFNIEKDFERPESKMDTSQGHNKPSNLPRSNVQFDAEDSKDKEKVKKKLGLFVRNRPSADALTKAGILNSSLLVFGGRLTTQFEKAGNQIPRVILQCIDAVDKKGLQNVGIYRLSGNTAEVQKLRYCFNQDEQLDLINDPRWNDINVVTGALKLYLRELEDPVFTFERYETLIEIAKNTNVDAKMQSLRALIIGLPRAHHEVLRFVINHLRRVIGYSSVNKMEPANIAIVFGPTLMRSAVEDLSMVYNMAYQNALVEIILTNAEVLF